MLFYLFRICFAELTLFFYLKTFHLENGLWI